jgi:hypothetical protein
MKNEKKKMPKLVTARMENTKRGQKEDQGKDGLMSLKRI